MLENLFNFSKQYLLLSLPWLTSLMLSSSAYQIITFREYSRSYHNPQALWSSYNYGCSINTCSNCEFKCPSRWIDFYTDGIAFPVENKKVTWWTIFLCFWIRSVISAAWMMAIFHTQRCCRLQIPHRCCRCSSYLHTTFVEALKILLMVKISL